MEMPTTAKGLLIVLSVAIGALSLIGSAVTFIPRLVDFHGAMIPFGVTGVILGILSVFMKPVGVTRGSMVGIALCVAACIIGLIRLIAAVGVKVA
jgi:hypothetical protein